MVNSVFRQAALRPVVSFKHHSRGRTSICTLVSAAICELCRSRGAGYHLRLYECGIFSAKLGDGVLLEYGVLTERVIPICLGCRPTTALFQTFCCSKTALNISTGPLALRTFQTAGPVHCIFHWPCRTTELNVGPVD